MTIRRGDILWADLGMFPTTSVQGGVRPVIVVSNNKANTYSSVITVVPLTSIFDGPLRHQRNVEYIYACKS